MNTFLPVKSCRVCNTRNNALLDHSQYIEKYKSPLCLRCIYWKRCIIKENISSLNDNADYKTPNAAVLGLIVMRLETLLDYKSRYIINSMVCTPKWETNRLHIAVCLWINKNNVGHDPRGPVSDDSHNNWMYDYTMMCWKPYSTSY